MTERFYQILAEEIDSLPPDNPNRKFLEGIDAISQAYRDKPAEPERQIFKKADLSTIPYDVDREDPDSATLVRFIVGLDLPNQEIFPLIRYTASSFRLVNIRALYELSTETPGLQHVVPNIGPKTETALKQRLQQVLHTGVMPLNEELLAERLPRAQTVWQEARRRARR